MDRTVDVSKRDKAFTCVVTAEHLPENEDGFLKYTEMVRYLTARSDLAFVIDLASWNDLREILVTWSGEDYYVELSYPENDREGFAPLRLAADGYTFEDVCEILWSILVEQQPAHKIERVFERMVDVTEETSYNSANSPNNSISSSQHGGKASYPS